MNMDYEEGKKEGKMKETEEEWIGLMREGEK